MENNDKVLAALLAALVSPVSSERENAADEITDGHQNLTTSQIRSVVLALAQARLQEEDEACQEAQLNALADLKEWHSLDSNLFAELSRIGNIRDSQREYMECLIGASPATN